MTSKQQITDSCSYTPISSYVLEYVEDKTSIITQKVIMTI